MTAEFGVEIDTMKVKIGNGTLNARILLGVYN
jgi:hypothetical protein